MEIKKLLPQTLFCRFLLIILVPNIIIQMVAVYMFYERHWSGVSKHMAVVLAGDISLVVNTIEGEDEQSRNKVMNIASRNMYLRLDFHPNAKLDKSKEDIKDEFSDFSQILSSRIRKPFTMYYSDERNNLGIDIQLNEGVLHTYISKKRLANPSTYIFIMWMVGTAIIFLIISIFFMKNQVRSITDIAKAAQLFGQGKDSGNFKPSGAMEVRQVGQALIEMHQSISRQIEQRTEMLAGVSHDLKTPLTRIKLQLAMMPQSKEIKELEDDIIEMEKMIQDYLDFAKGKERVIDATVNVSDLLRSIIAGYRNHHKKIELKAKAGVNIHINSNSLRRVITNIIDNAIRYGNEVKISLSTSQKNLIIIIDDNGCGIPHNKRNQVFKPFYKIDSSRHLESGSTGLGLAIAKDIVVGYNGQISLDDSPLGGLRVIIKLPL